MSQFSDIQLTLVQGQRDAYQNLLQDIKNVYPVLTSTEEEYIRQYNNFSPVDFVPFTSKYPGLLVEMDVKCEYEDASCRVRFRGKDFEAVEKEYPPFTSLLSTKESLLADSTFPLNVDLQQIDQRALDFLRRHLSKPITVNDDLPGTEIDVTFRTGGLDDSTITLLISQVIKEEKKIIFHGTDQHTGTKVSACEESLLPGQATWAVNRLHQEKYI